MPKNRGLSDECEPVSVPAIPLSYRSEKTLPLGERSGAGRFAGVVIMAVAPSQKVVVDRGVN